MGCCKFPIVKYDERCLIRSHHWSTILNKSLHLVCFAFIDSTSLIHTHHKSNDNRSLTKGAQDALNHWQGGLWATGSALITNKSYWFYVNCNYNTNCEAKYNKIKDIPGKMYLNNNYNVVGLTWLEASDSRKLIYTKMRKNGIETDNVDFLEINQ